MISDKLKDRFLKSSYWVFLATIVLLPIFLIPSGAISLGFSKTILLYVGISLSFIFFVFYVFKEEKLVIVNLPVLFLSSAAVLVVFFVSSIINSHRTLSLSGYGSEIGTFSFIFLFFSIFFLTILLFQSWKTILQVIFFSVFVFLILALLNLINFFGFFDLLPFGIPFLATQGSKTFTTLGSWHELSFLAGAMTVLSTIFLEVFLKREGRKIRLLFLATLVLSVLVLFITGVQLAWLLTFLTTLLFTLFYLPKQAKEKEEDKNPKPKIVDLSQVKSTSLRRVSSMTILILVLLLIFTLTSNYLSRNLYDELNIFYAEIKPSWSATAEVFVHTVKESKTNFFLGSGPNSFLFQWRNWKPDGVNLSNFWNSEFHYGAGLIPTFFVTTGILGLLSWLVFIGSFCWLGIKHLRKNGGNNISSMLFFVSLYLWMVLVFYTPSYTIFAFTAFFSGAFIVSLLRVGLVKSVPVSFSQNSKLGATVILSLVLILAVNLLSTFSVARKAFAQLNFESGAIALRNGNENLAETRISRAVSVSSNDVFERNLSAFYLFKINQRISGLENPSVEEIDQVRDLVVDAKEAAENAIIFNRKNFQNWVQLARFYEFLIRVDPQNAAQNIENARVSYQNAKSFDAKNPIIDVLLAQLELSAGNLDEAQASINSALDKKSNYNEAIFLRARIEAIQGNLDQAIISATQAVNLSPRNPTGYFELGLLYYQDKNFRKAREALERALLLDNEFANARYFLGLSLVESGDIEEAINHFEILSTKFPENTEVQTILSNLESGKGPLIGLEDEEQNIIPPPEERDELPIEESEEPEDDW